MPRCAAFVSDLVIAEAQLGNAEAASRRLHAIATLPVLPVTQDVITLSKEYTARLPVPRTAEADMIHLAVATLNGMNYLLTWNCKHIANAFVIESLARVNHGLGLDTPIICTPEELFHED